MFAVAEKSPVVDEKLGGWTGGFIYASDSHICRPHRLTLARGAIPDSPSTAAYLLGCTSSANVTMFVIEHGSQQNQQPAPRVLHQVKQPVPLSPADDLRAT